MDKRREVLFKAKTLKDGSWLEGSLVCYESLGEELFCIVPRDIELRMYRVDPDTICEYTGLDDREGNKIFEKDILDKSDVSPYHFVVFWNEGAFELYYHGIKKGDKPWFVSLAKQSTINGAKIVGNICDLDEEN